MIDSKHARAVVISRRDVSSDLWIVHIRPEQQVTFLPGQYLTIGLPDGARLVERPYSVASSPAEPDLEFSWNWSPAANSPRSSTTSRWAAKS